MFWGLDAKAGTNAAAKFESDGIRVTNISLLVDPDMTATDEVNVFVKIDGKTEYLIASLTSAKRNANVDLEIAHDDKITFVVKGKGTVHLTGYTMEDDGSEASSALSSTGSRADSRSPASAKS